MDVVGVDGTRGGWVAVRLTDGKFAGGRLFSAFCVLMRDFPEAAVLAVDIPIGLPPRGRRRADEEARRVLEFRRNSVFFVPPRSVLESPTFQQAILMARSLDSSVSQQIYALRDKILEVNRLTKNGRIVEVHPEVSFWALNGGRPLAYAKSTWNGFMTRLALLQAEGVELPTAIDDIGNASPDDIIDAAAAAWSGFRVARGEARSLPEPPERDQADRPVAIWY